VAILFVLFEMEVIFSQSLTQSVNFRELGWNDQAVLTRFNNAFFQDGIINIKKGALEFED
jgi:NADH:ubiquinone oxidoreductase subunit 3 (subunit A)